MHTKPSLLVGNVLMVIAAALWGFTFVAQKTGMDHLQPLMFTAIRFAIGATCLLFLIRFLGKQKLNRKGIEAGVIMGVLITFGITLQQIGIVETTAGKSGFITAIYILLVPIFLSLGGKKLYLQIWPAVVLALIGLYFLTIKNTSLETIFSSINNGDYWVLASSIFWALHIIYVGKAATNHDPLRLSIVQFYVCAILAFIAALVFEPVVFSDITVGVKGAWLEIAYSSVASVAIAFTLQVFAQQSVPPHYAAMILSLEAVFAVIGGVLLIGEVLTARMVFGFALIFAGIILAQYDFKKTPKIAPDEAL
jgi:drug/metabolite transporter (DMT)-like permease